MEEKLEDPRFLTVCFRDSNSALFDGTRIFVKTQLEKTESNIVYLNASRKRAAMCFTNSQKRRLAKLGLESFKSRVISNKGSSRIVGLMQRVAQYSLRLSTHSLGWSMRAC